MYSNVQVTFDSNPNNARSESDLAVNPLNPFNMVGSSKRFTNIVGYAFSLAAYATFDAGQTWAETILSLTDTNGTTYPSTTDPAVAFDDVGNVYIVALPWQGETGPNSGQTIGISIYQSTDGGLTWSTPVLIHSSAHDDKQAVWGDTNPSSPFKGNVYAAWDDTSGTGNMLFARTTDHGASWKGITQGAVDQPAGTPIPNISDSFSPEITVAPDGTVIIVWAQETGDTVKLVTSSDGGSTFSAPMVVASGITNLFAAFPPTGGWPTFPGASFRIITYATNSTSGSNLVVVWADAREGVSRIYYRHSPDGGTSWDGPASGQPLLTGALASGGTMQDFHPQIATTPTGEVGCVFYEYGPTGGGAPPPNLINVVLAVSTDGGTTFTDRINISDQAWNPALDAPNADADPAVTFIGDYFGLAASALGFFPFWTDTRTGIQEIWTAIPFDQFLPPYYAAIFEQSGGPAWEARHGLTSAQYQQTFNQLVGQGYRLIDVSGYEDNGQALYAAIFEQSGGPAWEARHGLTSAQYQQTFNQLVAQGYRLVLVDGYSVNGQALYAAIFEQSGGPAWEARHGLTSAQYQQTFNQLVAQGYRLLWVSGYR